MIDRQTVYQIADHAIREYANSRIVEANEARMRAAWATADRINEEYLVERPRVPVVYWMLQRWARERIARRKEMEAMSR